MVSIRKIREKYAKDICFSGKVKSELITIAFEQVAREDFVGCGPWSDSDTVKSLRTDNHEIDSSCWVHLGPFCLSMNS